MTFSVVGRQGDAVGVAVASRFLAVGAMVPAARAGVGAVATQSYANLAYRAGGLALLAHGRTSQQVLDELTASDDGRDQRQAGVVGVGPAAGPGATFTGAACHDWAGGRAGDDYAVQGNILVGPEVVDAMESAWHAGAAAGGLELPERLLATLAAGDRAGGDRRGRQSAALLVVRPDGGYGGDDTEVDLRVDDHPSPVPELRRLLGLHRLYFGSPDPATLLPLEGALAAEVAERLDALGYRRLEDWAGVENYEERLVDGRIDPLVLDKLREATAAPR
jgi:uncharacterized Ntn-hydrolase superfamily protein